MCGGEEVSGQLSVSIFGLTQKLRREIVGHRTVQRCATMAAGSRSMGGASSKLTLVLGMLPSSVRLGAIHDHTNSSLR